MEIGTRRVNLLNLVGLKMMEKISKKFALLSDAIDSIVLWILRLVASLAGSIVMAAITIFVNIAGVIAGFILAVMLLVMFSSNASIPFGAIILYGIAVICFIVVQVLEPTIPKRDRRFKSGYKNNATYTPPPDSTKLIQFGLIILIFILLWFVGYLRKG